MQWAKSHPGVAGQMQGGTWFEWQALGPLAALRGQGSTIPDVWVGGLGCLWLPPVGLGSWMGNYGARPLLGQLPPLSVPHGDEEQGRAWNPACGLSSGVLVGSLCLAPMDGCVHSLSRTQLDEMASFDFTVWRKRYLQWISHRKSRVLDIFRSIDRGQDGRITQQEFVEHVLASSECRSGAAFLQGTTDVGWVPFVGTG